MVGKSLRSLARISSVESVVVWSSMSRVTVVPASVAAAQMARALSYASCSSKAWPSAESFRLTSAAGREAGAGQGGEQREVLLADRVGLLGGERVLAEVVEGDRQPVADELAGGAERVVGAGAGDEAADDVAAERGGLDEPFDLV